MTRLTLSSSARNAANVSIFSSGSDGPALVKRDIIVHADKPDVSLDLRRGDYIVQASWANGATQNTLVRLDRKDETYRLEERRPDQKADPFDTPLAAYVFSTPNPTDFLTDLARANAQGLRSNDVLSNSFPTAGTEISIRSVNVPLRPEEREKTCELRVWRADQGQWLLIRPHELPAFLDPRPVSDNCFGFILHAGVRVAIEVKKREAPPRVVAFPGFAKSHEFSLSLRNSAGQPRILPAISARVHDASLQALLDLLARTDNPSAEGLFEETERFDRDAQSYLLAKTEDPFAATAAAYLLVRHRRLDLLHNWTFNLARWNPTLPDASIILGWHLLLSANEGNQREASQRALGHFQEAISLGFPVFDEGLSLIEQGLRFVGRLLDGGLGETAAKLLSRIEPQLNNRAPFGAFAGFVGSGPDEPGETEKTVGEPTFTVRLT